ncbi:MAG TPA: HIT domain-containing protein [Phycisphaerae bacterium]|nr:HIT domain-containing protein [Phycisphaerae bacterium]
MADFNPNVWAPWRMEYIRSLETQNRDVGCFLCHYWQNPHDDRANHVVLRRGAVFAVMNRFPYTNGHLLIAPAAHRAELGALDDDVLSQLTTLIRDAIAILTDAIGPQGFNVGYNIGRCAGAGLPDHIHGHIVPRWNADTNYMAVLGGIRVIPDALDATFEQLTAAAERLGLRNNESG